MKQSRGTSLLKSTISTAVGFIVALAANALVLPLFGFHPSFSENFQITCIYTLISVARGYLLERAFEAMGWRTRMSAAAIAVLAERQRQIEVEGWTPSHDDEHAIGAIGRAGAAYLLWEGGYARGCITSQIWPWDREWFKPRLDDPRRNLIRGTALALAECEKFDRRRTMKRSL
jgi:hypothetical protein